MSWPFSPRSSVVGVGLRGVLAGGLRAFAALFALGVFLGPLRLLVGLGVLLLELLERRLLGLGALAGLLLAKLLFLLGARVDRAGPALRGEGHAEPEQQLESL